MLCPPPGDLPGTGIEPSSPDVSCTGRQVRYHQRQLGSPEGKMVVVRCVQLFPTPWTIACQDPRSAGVCRREYWSGLPFPFPGVFRTQGLHPHLLHSQVDSFPLHYLGIVSLCERPALSLCVWSAWRIISTWKLLSYSLHHPI